jgi:pilus assembly protein CpaF
MVLMANMGLTEPVIRQQADSAIQLVVQMTRFRDGSRKVASIAEVVGANDESVAIEEIYRFDRSFDRFIATGYRPQFLKRLQAAGVDTTKL